VIVFYLIKARHEEGILLAHFPGYAAYRARTRGVLLKKGRRASG
jgi:protein-S-isoprenylcysteine O-methyltransferase Ste14